MNLLNHIVINYRGGKTSLRNNRHFRNLWRKSRLGKCQTRRPLHSSFPDAGPWMAAAQILGSGDQTDIEHAQIFMTLDGVALPANWVNTEVSGVAHDIPRRTNSQAFLEHPVSFNRTNCKAELIAYTLQGKKGRKKMPTLPPFKSLSHSL